MSKSIIPFSRKIVNPENFVKTAGKYSNGIEKRGQTGIIISVESEDHPYTADGGSKTHRLAVFKV